MHTWYLEVYHAICIAQTFRIRHIGITNSWAFHNANSSPRKKRWGRGITSHRVDAIATFTISIVYIAYAQKFHIATWYVHRSFSSCLGYFYILIEQYASIFNNCSGDRFCRMWESSLSKPFLPFLFHLSFIHSSFVLSPKLRIIISFTCFQQSIHFIPLIFSVPTFHLFFCFLLHSHHYSTLFIEFHLTLQNMVRKVSKPGRELASSIAVQCW